MAEIKMPESNTSKHTKLSAYFLGFITFVLIVYILMALQDILIPVTIAVFLTFLFHPVLLWLRKFGVPKWAGIILIFMMISAFYYLLGWLFIASLSTLPDKASYYSENLSLFAQQFLSTFNLSFKEFAELVDMQVHEFEISTVFEGLLKIGILRDLLSYITSMLGDFVIVMVFWSFMMAGKSKFEERLQIAFASNRESLEKGVENIDNQLQQYVVIKTILSLLTGIITTIILLAYGIDFAIVWGILTFILNYIPNIGSLIATVCPILMSMLQYGFGFSTISLTVLLLLNQNIIGNLIEPNYLGKQMNLSPVFVLFSLIFWGYVWGIVGMFLSVPIASAMKILFSNIEPLKPIAILMGSKSQSLIISSDNPDSNSNHIILKKK